ncbi:MAG: hypothetical protein H6746_09015 [Deltaproteobacteria bacterium]|nr:hypothetical protein [Deltaproteobacteria bacterium]
MTSASTLRAALAGALLLSLMASCADGGLVVDKGDTPPSPDVQGETEVSAPDVDASDAADTSDVTDADAVADADADAAVTCPGGFGCPCQQNGQCFSDFCVSGPDGLECSRPCDDACPSGYSCRPVTTSFGDPAFICVYDHIFYCWPCKVNDDCAPALVEGSPHRCLPGADPSAGSFCATACEQTADCPPGAVCEGTEDGGTGHCQPQVGECACSEPAKNAGAMTDCAQENAFGRCTGQRVCGAGGLTACSAQEPTAELCNGQDDDCDGKTDEAFPEAEQSCDGQDADDCADGVWHCSGGALSCDDDSESTSELCNGQDDDCDGATDETFPKLGSPCDGQDADLCADGSFVCDAFGGMECDDDIAPRLETCDDQDEDCDGLTDETFPTKGQACDGPADEDTCADGKLVCGPDGELVCDDAPGTKAEVCNGIDDDCDGNTDEGFPDKGALCDGDDEDGCPDGTLVCDASGGLSCSDDAASTVEVCNGKDDDCDGKTDEAFPLLGAACDGGDDDECPDGKWACDGVGLVCDDDAAATTEVCNAVDDDCDGSTDEDYIELGQACDGPDSDDCAGGVWACDGVGTTCTDSPGDSADVCNDLDDDCDGSTDEDFPTKGQPCDGEDADACAEGTWVCGAGALVCNDDAESKVELCNGADDDCDGAADEDFPAKGSLCDGEDDDLCKDGTLVCDGVGLSCDDDAAGKVELCNSEDDDCDGTTDEGFETVGQPCDGQDADSCADGFVVCAGETTLCDDDGLSKIETCDGTDQDCDGKTDEDFPTKGQACDGADPDACEDGQYVCKPDGTGVTCQDDPGTQAELCNGIDDDCDGKTDEDFPTKGQPCDNPADADKCKDGTLVCDGQALVCNDDADSIEEACNDLDDDCDAATDETFPLKGTLCDGPDADLCAEGLWSCNGAILVCSDDATSKGELCNNQDDDCDGATDEAFPAKGQACDGQDADSCADGSWVCDGQGLVCNDDATAKVEACNTVDDDCDGTTDEGFPSVGAPCDGTDADLCKDGTFVCHPTLGLTCNDDAGSVAELCNSQDDDCDGKTDESFPTKGDACDGGDADLCKEGTLVCNAAQSGLTCDDATGNNAETCNGIDDDCDGQTDEGVTRGCSTSCGSGTEACAFPGWTGCTAPQPKTCYDYASCSNQPSCAATCPSAPTEVCDGVDNNCNGQTDEGFYGDTSNGGLDFPNLWSTTIPQLGSYPGNKSGVVKGRLNPQGDSDWWTLFATEDSFDFCAFSDDAPIVARITFTSPGAELWYDVCACWSSADTFCGQTSGGAASCVTSKDGAPVVLTVDMRATCDLFNDDSGYLDVQVRPNYAPLDYGCGDWTATWQISE